MSITLFQHTFAIQDRQELDGENDLDVYQSDGYYLARRQQLTANNQWDTIAWEKELVPGAFFGSDRSRMKLRTEKRHLGDGGYTYHEGVDAKIIEVTGTIFFENLATVRQWEDQLRTWASRPFLKLRFRPDRYYNLSAFKGFKWTTPLLRDRKWAEFELSWVVDDPYQYAMTRTTAHHSGGTGYFAVDNGTEDRNQSVWPTITLSGWDKSGQDGTIYTNNGAAFLQNQTFLHRKDFNLTSPIFGLYAETEMDTEFGEVWHFHYPNVGRLKLDATVTNLQDILDGDGFKLLAGENSIYFAGNPTHICFCFRQRWL
jgi:hypothetical protein